jgi:hypothetical protein
MVVTRTPAGARALAGRTTTASFGFAAAPQVTPVAARCSYRAPQCSVLLARGHESVVLASNQSFHTQSWHTERTLGRRGPAKSSSILEPAFRARRAPIARALPRARRVRAGRDRPRSRRTPHGAAAIGIPEDSTWVARIARAYTILFETWMDGGYEGGQLAPLKGRLSSRGDRDDAR